jgi:hypothetical protein
VPGAKPRAGAFFSLTSNVDAHWLQSFAPETVYECHGNTEKWHCADRQSADSVWQAPPGFRFSIDGATRIAADGSPAAPAEDDKDTGSERAADAISFGTN